MYGTLKHSQPAHRRYCVGCIDVQPATVLGRLYLSHAGYPTLVVPDQTILARATAEAAADLEVERVAAADVQGEKNERPKVGDWLPVEGEVLSFESQSRLLAVLDRYEDCKPGLPSLYERVLVSVYVGDRSLPAWTYVSPTPPPQPLVKHLGLSWP